MRFVRDEALPARRSRRGSATDAWHREEGLIVSKGPVMSKARKTSKQKPNARAAKGQPRRAAAKTPKRRVATDLARRATRPEARRERGDTARTGLVRETGV